MEKDLSEYYKLVKAAAKEKSSRKRITKELEKAKGEYGKLKANLDDLESKKSDLNIKLESAKSQCGMARKKMLKLHKTMQSMDISNASDAIFYQDSEDTGYIINGKEYHLQMSDDGETELVPMLHHRRSKKQKDVEECVEVPDEDFDNLYLELTE